MPNQTSNLKGYSVIFSKIIALTLSIISLSVLNISLTEKIEIKHKESLLAQSGNTSDVLGHYSYGKPQIYITGGNYKYSAGGVIPIASTDDPVVEIGGYNVSGKFIIDVFESNFDALKDYLVYKNENEQVAKEIDTGKFTFVTTVEKDGKLDYSSPVKVALPLKDSGIYFLRVKINDHTSNAFVVRSNIGALVKEGNGEYVFWGQDFRNKKSISSGNVRIYNFKDSIKEISNVSFSNEGIARSNLTSEADVAFIFQDPEIAVVPLNLLYLNTGYSWQRFRDKSLTTRYFTFTDRPLYRPGDTIYFKSILREEDDVRYFIPTKPIEVTIIKGGDESPIFKQSFNVSSSGTISGEFELPKDVRTGSYILRWGQEWDSYIDFEVQEFRKPEYFIEIDSEKREFVSGDTAEIKVKGQYFSGQPLSGRVVEYSAYSADFFDYGYYSYLGSRNLSDDYRYGYWYGRNSLGGGKVELDINGEGVIKLDTKLKGTSGKNQVVTVEAKFSDASTDPSYDRKNFLVYGGEYGIYRNNNSYGVKVGEKLDIPVKLAARKDGVNLVGREIKINGTFSSYISSGSHWNPSNKDIPEIKIKTDSNGEATFTLNPDKTGSYTLNVSSVDERGNEVKNTFYSYVSDRDYSYFGGDGKEGISITPDKSEYKPGETAKLTIFSEIPNRDVFLSFERGRLNRYQIVSVNGNTRTLEVPIVNTDMPNIFVEASSFSNKSLEVSMKDLVVSPEEMRLNVEITSDSEKYGPGDNAEVTVTTKDKNGNPVAAELALWAVDKAIFELTDSNLTNIFDKFWFKRYNQTVSGHSLEGIRVQTAEGGGCFAKGTKVMMADGTYKNIEEVKKGDIIKTRKSPLDGTLVDAKVLDAFETEASGYLLINGKLRISDNHKILVNGIWKMASEIVVGDLLISESGSMFVESIEWVRGKFTLHNLHIDKYQTFFADGIYVHNQKGGPAREVLKDTAYWNPNIYTGTDGKATVVISLPDNLTTWALSAVASTGDTKVGQTKSEITVSKDIIVRPILPNIMREGDEIMLSALVQNFTDKDRSFNTLLEFKNGLVENAEITNLKIGKGGTEQVFWKVKPQKTGEAELKFTAYDTAETDSGDVIVKKLPVELFGFSEVQGFVAEGNKTYSIAIAEDAKNDESHVKLALAPTILGTLPSAMEYLVDYPYGCIEQTTSKLVPSIIAGRNSALFADVLRKKDVKDIIEKGIARVISLQNADGSWGWWGGNGNAFMSAYVTEYMLEAQKEGYEVDSEMLNDAKGYFERLNASTSAERSARYYALTLLGSEKRSERPAVEEDMDPVTLSMLVMANIKNGVNNADENGLNNLLTKAKRDGESVHWDGASWELLGSTSASTGMAIRALVASGSERETAVAAVRYLTQNKKRHYWENSFGTAQVIRAIIDLSKTGSEQNPDYSYKVTLGGKLIKSGTIENSNIVINDIIIPMNLIGNGTNDLVVEKSGEGQLYSTLIVKEFRTDREYKGNGRLNISRKIINDKGENYTLGVGDVARVTIDINNWPSGSQYAVLEDHLPSGLVPINETFKNEGGRDNYNYYGRNPGREYTRDGIIYANENGSIGSFSYKARVVNAGTFDIPPATASLMYLPEIYGASDAQKIVIYDKSIKTYDIVYPSKPLTERVATKVKSTLNRQSLPYIIVVLVALGVFAYRKRDIIKRISARLIYGRKKTADSDIVNTENEETDNKPQV